jgi:group II intron reverse transcriptase/maturase
MLTATTSKRLDALGELSKQGKRINGLFRLIENPTLWLQAYINIYANKGAATGGIDGRSLDGFSKERVLSLIKQLKENRFRFQPVKRVYIPKANGKKRPLGIPTGDDKLVAEVVRMILEKIYEPIFMDTVHGFRPGRSCHTALKDIKCQWNGVKWIIDMDVEQFFDSIDHALLIQFLRKKIDDEKFIQIIEGMLKAGYVENCKVHRTYSGTAQGSVASPLLANIYLHELDFFISKMRNEFNKGKGRASKPSYERITATIRRSRRKIDKLKQQVNTQNQIQSIKKQIKELDRQRKETMALEPLDPNYKRMWYCRYTDDFVIGIIGAKQEAYMIRDKVQEFIETQLNLKIAQGKSHIVHGQKGARFLGYNIQVYAGDKVIRTTRVNRHTRVRSMSLRMQLHIPLEKTRAFCKNKGYGNYDKLKASHRTELLNLSDAEIVQTYNAELRGLANYYVLALDFRHMGRVMWLWKRSLLKTLAAKHKTTIHRITNQMRTPEGLILKVQAKNKTHLFKVFNIKDIKREPVTYEWIDKEPNTWQFTLSKTELVQRLDANHCEYCGGRNGKFEIHHIRKLKDLKEGKKKWQVIMARRQRKTLVLCTSCHDLLHAGRLPDWRNNST